jgi:succinate dehydrogenase flavin-adding protein (antitoxin of CptAB toxin-antitoxin module)
MAVGSEPEIGIEFTTWGKMTEASKEAWLAHLRGMRERGNIFEGYATIHYPKGRQNYG